MPCIFTDKLVSFLGFFHVLNSTDHDIIFDLFIFSQLATADKVAAFCLTEPSSGSDAGVCTLYMCVTLISNVT